jgi:ubiquinone biosynthesis protein Coq4
MTGRIETITVPPWEPKELVEIPKIGFPLLNCELSNNIINKLASEAIGSPHLMQEFCREICNVKGIKETLDDKTKIETIDTEQLFKTVSLNTGKVYLIS